VRPAFRSRSSAAVTPLAGGLVGGTGRLRIGDGAVFALALLPAPACAADLAVFLELGCGLCLAAAAANPRRRLAPFCAG
jgi:hypothetical protein